MTVTQISMLESIIVNIWSCSPPMKIATFIDESVKKKEKKNPAHTGDVKWYLVIPFSCRSVSLEVFKEAILVSFAFQAWYTVKSWL